MNLPRTKQDGPDVLLWIKAVPNASRDEIAGVLGDRLKIRVAAAPESGRANRAICRVLAHSLDVAENLISVESGKSTPMKVMRIRRMDSAALLQRLAAWT